MTDFDEKRRLAALQALNVLDTPEEPAFERITDLAVLVLGIDTVLISLLDEDRQWFKSRRGLVDCAETPREWAFCNHTVRKQAFFEVLDPEADPRFATNPLVLEGPRVRYYAGAPVTMPGGEAVGTLCLLDNQPRPGLDQRERQILAALAELVARELELRQTLRQALSLVSLAR